MGNHVEEASLVETPSLISVRHYSRATLPSHRLMASNTAFSLTLGVHLASQSFKVTGRSATGESAFINTARSLIAGESSGGHCSYIPLVQREAQFFDVPDAVVAKLQSALPRGGRDRSTP